MLGFCSLPIQLEAESAPARSLHLLSEDYPRCDAIRTSSHALQTPLWKSAPPRSIAFNNLYSSNQHGQLCCAAQVLCTWTVGTGDTRHACHTCSLCTGVCLSLQARLHTWLRFKLTIASQLNPTLGTNTLRRSRSERLADDAHELTGTRETKQQHSGRYTGTCWPIHRWLCSAIFSDGVWRSAIIILGTQHAPLLASQGLRGQSQSKASKQNTDVAAIVLKHCTNRCASGRTGQMAPSFHHAAGPTSATNLFTIHRLRSQNHQAIHTRRAFVADKLSALATSTHDFRILYQVSPSAPLQVPCNVIRSLLESSLSPSQSLYNTL